MASTIQFLTSRGVIKPPKFVEHPCYEVLMGSVMYGVSDDTSDMDIYGFCIPPKDMVFPHLAGEIEGFGKQKKRFEQFQQHHVYETSTERNYDITIYSIVKFFSLCMDNNPNFINCLYAPQNSILHSTEVANMIRNKRKIFIHKGLWHKYKGYSYSQLHKMRLKNPEPGSKRAAIVGAHGFDCKFGYHLIRLLYEAEMLLTEGDLDLQRHREHLKAIRRGDVTQKEVEDWAAEKEKALERAYEASTLPWGPPEAEIKQLLLSCLEHHYGSISDCVTILSPAEETMKKIIEAVNTYRGQ